LKLLERDELVLVQWNATTELLKPPLVVAFERIPFSVLFETLLG
jgi:hypothetical protein